MIKSVWKCINIIGISPKRGKEQAEIIDTFWTYHVHAWYPLFVCPERLLRAGQSLMVTNSNAFRSNSSCLCSSHARTPFSFHSCKSSSTNGLRYISMSLPCGLGPWMRNGIIMNFRFMHIQGGRLYIHRVTGQVL